MNHLDARRQALDLLARRERSHSLPRPFYVDQAFHDLDIVNVWERCWLFAGPSAAIPAPGQWFTLDVGPSSIVVIRGQDRQVRAFYNTCRHRGSKICLGEQGKVANLVCPYHQWTYNLEGRLLFARNMDEDFDPSKYPLKSVHCRTVGGYVFICLADVPPDFDAFASTVEPYMAPHDLEHAKVACSTSIVERGNWKLVMENNRECYHCEGNHPELLRTLAYFDSTDDPRMTAEFRERLTRKASDWERQGLPHEVRHSGDNRWRVVRQPFEAGTSMTMDGRPACSKLMGTLPDFDLGSLRILHLPNTWNHLQGDHSIAFRVLPMGPMETLVTTWWLVHPQAQEGVDYSAENVARVWTATNDQDRRLVEHAQAGVMSRGYQPGPYAQAGEFGTQAFVDWYVAELKSGLDQLAPMVPVHAA